MDWVQKLFDGPFGENLKQTEEDRERTAREADFIVRELKLGSRDRVLDLACGYGRHALEIGPHVAGITGIDRTAAYIERARELAEQRGLSNLHFRVADMRELEHRAEFNAAYNYFTAWGYYAPKVNFDILKRVVRALKPGGRFLLEIIGRDALMRRYRERSWEQADKKTFVLMENRFDVATGLQHNKRTYIRRGKAPEVIEIAHYIPAPDHLAKLFTDAGFANVHVVSAPDGAEPTIDSFRIGVIGTLA